MPIQQVIPQRLHAAIQRVIRETRGFNDRKQEAWCRVCRDRDPYRLHDPECCIYELHGAWEEALSSVTGDGNRQQRSDAVDPAAPRGQEGSTRASSSDAFVTGEAPRG